MREISDIEDDIAAKTHEIGRLYAELDAAKLERDKEICRRFDAGENFNHIGRHVGLSHHTVKNILWRNGRTVAGRQAIKTMKASLGVK